ncbi:hypothetical protein [Neomoorella thermoacetica]|uniref:hypothetical protein n=1 Tax=Neomoorella thermoacetica TaxID=1525 RepID=UPI0015D6609E|nr:hypothetical protein [Moorella thermoacetica]
MNFILGNFFFILPGDYPLSKGEPLELSGALFSTQYPFTPGHREREKGAAAPF